MFFTFFFRNASFLVLKLKIIIINSFMRKKTRANTTLKLAKSNLIKKNAVQPEVCMYCPPINTKYILSKPYRNESA